MLIKSGNLGAVRWYSELNPDMDFVVVCPANETDIAIRALRSAENEYFHPAIDEENDIPFFGVAYTHLRNAGVTVIVCNYYDPDHEDDFEYENLWGEYIECLSDTMEMYVVYHWDTP